MLSVFASCSFCTLEEDKGAFSLSTIPYVSAKERTSLNNNMRSVRGETILSPTFQFLGQLSSPRTTTNFQFQFFFSFVPLLQVTRLTRDKIIIKLETDPQNMDDAVDKLSRGGEQHKKT